MKEMNEYHVDKEYDYSRDELGRAYGTGRRKTSVARVWLYEGSGFITVNGRELHDYLPAAQRDHVLEPFLATKTAGCFDVMATVKGGGISGKSSCYSYNTILEIIVNEIL